MNKDIQQQAAELAASFRARGNSVASSARAAVTKGCLLVERTAKENITKTPIDTTIVYKRHGVSHSPSLPFNPPAVDTGRLRASITHRTEGLVQDKNVTGFVGTNVEYAPYLEFGTSRGDHGILLPRPFLIPALEQCRKQIIDFMKEAVHGGLKNMPTEGGDA